MPYRCATAYRRAASFFREKALLPHIRRDMIDFLKIPFYAINSIKQGEGWTTPDGDFYPHERLVFPAEPARTYAYFSDTSFMPQYAPFIRGIDLLYHEATFGREFMARARETQHSTAAEAAEMARLAQVKQLVIGHFSSRYEDEQELLDEASAILPIPLWPRGTLHSAVNEPDIERPIDK